MFYHRNRSLTIEQIVDNIKRGARFGLFDINNSIGGTWFFEDGRRMKEDDLWTVLKAIYSLDDGHGKTLKQLCPDTYVGTFRYTNKEHDW